MALARLTKQWRLRKCEGVGSSRWHLKGGVSGSLALLFILSMFIGVYWGILSSSLGILDLHLASYLVGTYPNAL